MSFGLYSGYEKVKRNLNWSTGDGGEGMMPIVLYALTIGLALLFFLPLYMRNRRAAAIFYEKIYRKDDEFDRAFKSRSTLSKFFHMPWRCPRCGNKVQSFRIGATFIYFCQECKVNTVETVVEDAI